MDVRLQRLPLHLHVGLVQRGGEVFHAGVAVRQRQQLVLAQLLPGGAALIVLLQHAAGHHDQLVHILLLVVHAVGLQLVVGVDQRNHPLEVAALIFIVPVFHQRHAAEEVDLALHLGKLRHRQILCIVFGDQPVGHHPHPKPVRAASLLQLRRDVHAEQRRHIVGVLIYHERIGRGERRRVGRCVRIHVHVLNAPAVDRRVVRVLHVHRIHAAAGVQIHNRIQRLRGCAVAHRVGRGLADQITGRHGGDVPPEGVGDAVVRQPAGAPALQNVVVALVVFPQFLQPGQPPQMLLQHALQHILRGQAVRLEIAHRSLNHFLL